MYAYYDLIDEINTKVQDFLESQAVLVKAEALGLDKRAGYKFYVTEDFIAVESSQEGWLAYYGGFEYVDEDDVDTAGEWVFYSSNSDRVQGHIQTWLDSLESGKEANE